MRNVPRKVRVLHRCLLALGPYCLEILNNPIANLKRSRFWGIIVHNSIRGSCRNIHFIYKLCIPLVSMGSSHIAKNATRYKPPAAQIGPEALTLPTCAATKGAERPAIRLSKLAMPEPVPRTGAGNTSGVYA